MVCSEILGRTVGEVDFHNRYRVLVVGLWRQRGWLRTELSRVQLRAGGVLVLMGSPLDFARWRRSRAFLLLMPFQQEGLRRHKAPLAAAIMAGTVGRLSGLAGVALAIKGPGLTNMVPGLAVSAFESFPMVAVVEAYGSAAPAAGRSAPCTGSGCPRSAVPR